MLPRRQSGLPKVLFSEPLDDEQGVALKQYDVPKSTLQRFYYRPVIQVALVGLICFLCPGLFNAITSLGASGELDSRTSANSLTALYSTFAAFGFIAGSIVSKLGVRATLGIGAAGYSLYIASLLTNHVHQSHSTSVFVIAAGAILGMCAAFTWTAQGTLMLALPTEAQKGRFVGLFWVLLNFGDVLGAVILLGESHDDTSSSVSTAGYSVILGLTAAGAILPWFLVPPRKITRDDGTRVIPPRHPSWLGELKGLVLCIYNDPLLCLMFPFFAFSNAFYTYHFNVYNAGQFTIRARALNAMLYWIMQLITAPLFGLFLDSSRFSRRMRARVGWCIVFILTMVVWGATLYVQRGFSRQHPRSLDFHTTDNPAMYAGLTILYLFCGCSDAAWQVFAYWTIGALSNNPRKLSFIVGIYKSLQSATNAVFWRLDANKISFLRLFAITWGCLSASLIVALPMILTRVTNYTTTSVRVVETEADLAHLTSRASVSGIDSTVRNHNLSSLPQHSSMVNAGNIPSSSQYLETQLDPKRLTTIEENAHSQEHQLESLDRSAIKSVGSNSDDDVFGRSKGSKASHSS